MKGLLIPVPTDIKIQNENAKKYVKNYKEYERLASEADNILEKTYEVFESNFL
ncbi:MAG: hypothetical protein COA61_003435 [Zetaproteobacteria bacterium]|nr:hypothetical protein [Zetaproteobacteria bacterium]